MMVRHCKCFGGDGAPLVVVQDAHASDALEEALTRPRCESPWPIPVDGDRGRGPGPLMGLGARRLLRAPRARAVPFSARFQVVAARRDGCEGNR